jgi:hypothetical protein
MYIHVYTYTYTYTMPLKKLKGCSRKSFREGKCNNYQAIRCDKKNNKTKKVVKKTVLFFNNVKEREVYIKSSKYKSRKCDKTMRYSVLSVTPKRVRVNSGK